MSDSLSEHMEPNPERNDPMINKHVIVTTAHRGVFFGRLVEDRGDVVTLEDAQNCVYWESSVRGFLGLAVTGPSDGCRIGPACPSLTLSAVTSIARCTEEAVQRWKEEPWK